jgi:branched-chain amino acid aminotransferase
VVIYCQFIPFRSLAKGFLAGVKLLTTSTRRIPSQFLDARAKVRNYLNLILAELEARAAGPEFWPLVLDADGFVSENVGGNFFAVIDGKLYTPPTYKALAGIARATVMDYARKLRIPIEEKDILLYDVINAEEAFLTSTSKMIMPVSHINGVKIGERVPGPITKCLADAWIKDTGVDFVRQAASHLTEEERKQLPEPWTDKID